MGMYGAVGVGFFLASCVAAVSAVCCRYASATSSFWSHLRQGLTTLVTHHSPYQPPL
jgi:hypothetical protein